MRKNIPAVVLTIAILILWQIVAVVINAAYILPSPTQVIAKIWELRANLFLVQLPATMPVTFLGLLISIVFGVGLSVIMDLNKKIADAVYPIIIAYQTIPTTAIAPLFVLWFGYSIWARVLVTILITFFPITITVYDGFRSTKREMEELLLTYGAGKKDVFLKLKVPTALPYFFSAIKMAIPLSVIGADIAEWLGAQSGLGYFSKRMMTQLDGAAVFAPIVILSLCAMVSVAIVGIIEDKCVKWRNDI